MKKLRSCRLQIDEALDDARTVLALSLIILPELKHVDLTNLIDSSDENETMFQEVFSARQIEWQAPWG